MLVDEAIHNAHVADHEQPRNGSRRSVSMQAALQNLGDRDETYDGSKGDQTRTTNRHRASALQRYTTTIVF